MLAEDEFRDLRDVGIVIQCYLRDCRRRSAATARMGRPSRHADLGAAGERRLLGLRNGPCQAQRLADARVSAEMGIGRQFRTAHAVLDAATTSCCGRRWEATTCARSPTGSRWREFLGVPPDAYELQMLYGMGEPEKQAFVDLGHRVRIYMPFGELIPGMAYLVRRLLENTSNDSFLRASFAEHVAM